jgi:amino acid transporter
VQVFWNASPELIVAITLSGLAAVAIWGVKESLSIAAVFTLVEAAGLLAVIIPAAAEPGRWLEVAATWPSDLAPAAVGGILMGAFLAFYAFLGFEDMVNLAEEAENPQRDMPAAVIIALVISTAFYALTVWAALAYMTPRELDASGAPIADLYRRLTGGDPALLTLVAMFAVINGALVQIIMVSRLLYGMGRYSRLLQPFSVVSPGTRTPVRATVVVAVIVLALALWLPVRTLAEYTSALVLLVFVMVNSSLIAVKRSQPLQAGVRPVPGWVPWLGLVTTISLLGYVWWNELVID